MRDSDVAQQNAVRQVQLDVRPASVVRVEASGHWSALTRDSKPRSRSGVITLRHKFFAEELVSLTLLSRASLVSSFLAQVMSLPSLTLDSLPPPHSSQQNASLEDVLVFS